MEKNNENQPVVHTSTNFNYIILDNGDLRIIEYIGKSPNVIVPISINKRKVTEIDPDTFANNDSIKEISIGGNVCIVEPLSFQNCHSLENIQLSPSTMLIGYAAFSNCSSLRNIEIPENVTCIESRAFVGCESFTYITIPDSVRLIGRNAFAECHNLMSISIGTGLGELDCNVFEFCNNLKSLRFDSEKEILLKHFYHIKRNDELTFFCHKDSPIYKFAIENGIKTATLSSKINEILRETKCEEPER